MIFEKVFIVLLFALAPLQVYVVYGQRYVKDDFTCLEITARPDIIDNGFRGLNPNNINRTHDKGCSFTLSRHHIIPYSLVRDAFNLALQKAAWDIRLKSAIYVLVDGAIENARHRTHYHADAESLNAMSTEAEQQFAITALPRRPFIIGPNSGESRRVSLIQASLVWAPFNWFEGPSPRNRENDPGDNFDYESKAIISEGLYNRLRDLNSDLQCFKSSPSDVDCFIRAADEWKRLYDWEPFGHHRFSLIKWTLTRIVGTQCKFAAVETPSVRSKA